MRFCQQKVYSNEIFQTGKDNNFFKHQIKITFSSTITAIDILNSAFLIDRLRSSKWLQNVPQRISMVIFNWNYF